MTSVAAAKIASLAKRGASGGRILFQRARTGAKGRASTAMHSPTMPVTEKRLQAATSPQTQGDEQPSADSFCLFHGLRLLGSGLLPCRQQNVTGHRCEEPGAEIRQVPALGQQMHCLGHHRLQRHVVGLDDAVGLLDLVATW